MTEKPSTSQSGALAPAAAFALLVVAVAVGYLLTRPGEPEAARRPKPQTSALEPGHTLTDQEALARFMELDALRISAFEERNVRSLQRAFVPDSAELRRGIQTIRKLLRDEVLMAHDPYQNLGLRVERNSNQLIEIEQDVRFHIEFVTEDGKNVTRQGRPERLTVAWILERHQSEWLLSEGSVVKAGSE